MAIRIGKIRLSGVQNLHTEESRTLVEQRVPDQQGSVFQDLGREPLTLVLEGLFFGEGVLSDLEELRQAQSKAKPLPFAADITIGTDLTDVIIEDVRIQHVAGYAQLYRFAIRLREHVAPPQPAAANLAPVNAGIKADADKWGAGSLAAAEVLQNPDKLAAALAAHPDLANHLSTNEIEGLVDGMNKEIKALTGMLTGMAVDLNLQLANIDLDAPLQPLLEPMKSLAELDLKAPMSDFLDQLMSPLKSMLDALGKEAGE